MPNVLYLKEVENTFRITVDTSKDHAMIVNMGNNSIIKFREFCDGIYCFDISGNENPRNKKVSNCYLLSTIAYNKTYLKHQENG